MSNSISNIANFESIKQLDESKTEFWTARELMPILGYSSWRNYIGLIKKARILIQSKYYSGKIQKIKSLTNIGFGAKREIEDFKIDRDALDLLTKMAHGYKLFSFTVARSEIIFLSELSYFVKLLNKNCKFQYKFGKYTYDLFIEPDVLIEFDEPHHELSKQQSQDLQKEIFARDVNYKLIRFTTDTQIQDAIYKILIALNLLKIN